MGKRRKRSGSITHKRAILTGARPQRGMPWRKVADLLEELKEKHGYKAMGLEVFKLLWKLQRDNGWKGNAATQYVWEYYQSRGFSLTYNGLLDHIDGTEFGRWLDRRAGSADKGWTRVKEPKAKAKPIPARITEAQRIGAEYRAEMAAMKAQQATNSEQLSIQQDTELF